MIKNIFTILGILLICGITSCNKCDGNNPTLRIINNGAGAANIKLTPSSGKVITMNDVKKGTVSDYKEVASGKLNIDYTIGSLDTASTLNLSTCKKYDLTINSDDELVLFSKDIKHK